ncbi:hypothetical protein RB2150_05563 [Rhodobacterales bacterium HTCC2150]|nr:hypothetical protein RB2150_05563 [Rhodobacterales bacterium HTCC2150] [Rhodobacteraceae bacterium HTCC2150]
MVFFLSWLKFSFAEAMEQIYVEGGIIATHRSVVHAAVI